MILRIFDYITLALNILIAIPITILYLMLIFVSFAICRPIVSYRIFKDIIYHNDSK
jgi:hypothetical protein